MSGLDGVFLDFYGTVVGGDRRAVEGVCQTVIDDHGLDIDAAALAVEWGRYYFAAIEAVNGGPFMLLSDIERDTLVETLQPLIGRAVDVEPYIDRLNRYLVEPPLFEEARRVFQAMRLPVCIVSNADERELRAAVAHHGLRFHEIVTSESARSYKPQLRIFEAALQQTGWSADRVIHVGDSLHSDIEGAHNAGIRAAWVSRADRISDIGADTPDFTWSDLTPLITLS